MPTAPTKEQVKEYLGPDFTGTLEEIESALPAEIAAQGHVCRIPGAAGDPYPPDLAAALCRRVGRHLNMKTRLLGYEPGIDGGLNWISANDSEIRRLEAPFRKRAVR